MEIDLFGANKNDANYLVHTVSYDSDTQDCTLILAWTRRMQYDEEDKASVDVRSLWIVENLVTLYSCMSCLCRGRKIQKSIYDLLSVLYVRLCDCQYVDGKFFTHSSTHHHPLTHGTGGKEQ